MCILHLPVVDNKVTKGKSLQQLAKSHNPAKEALREGQVTEAEDIQDQSIFCKRHTAHPGHHSLSAGLSW